MLNNPLPGIPLVESPFFSELAKELPEDVRRIGAELHEKGFAVLDFPETDFDGIVAKVIADLEPEYDLEAGARRNAVGTRAGYACKTGAARVRLCTGSPATITSLSCCPSCTGGARSRSRR
jgi:hypothetical protein